MGGKRYTTTQVGAHSDQSDVLGVMGTSTETSEQLREAREQLKQQSDLIDQQTAQIEENNKKIRKLKETITKLNNNHVIYILLLLSFCRTVCVMAITSNESTVPPKDEVPVCIVCHTEPQMICDPEPVIVDDTESWRMQTPLSCGKYRHYCSGNCAKDDPDEFGYKSMRNCGCCGVSQNEQNFEGDVHECYSDEGNDY